MLTPDQKKFLSKISIIDVIDYYGVPAILSCIDCLHAIVVYGLDEVFKALERYRKKE